VAGINHMAWFLKFEWRGQDAYPLLRQRLAEWDKAGGDEGLRLENLPTNPYYGSEPWPWDTVRRELFRQFGYYVTESTPHLSEYLPYFRRNPELMKRYTLRAQGSEEFGPRWLARRDQQRDKLRHQAEGAEPIPMTRSTEYTSYIIESMETDKPYRVNVNVRNTGLITNLPPDCVVEVPCLVDGLGVHPCYVGDLPPQLAALNRTNINVQELAVKAALEGDREALYQAVALDPLTSATLPFKEIRQMVDEMFEALLPWMPQFQRS
jgi:alpha-galactosidase